MIGLLIIPLCISCIKDEALTAEADISSATIEDAAELLHGDPIINNQTVTFRLKDYQDSYEFAPQFKLSPGATIEPASGTEFDFLTPQQYTVTSEDGAWQKTYKVSFVVDNTILFKYSFENVRVIDTNSPEGHYHEFFEYQDGMEGERMDWDTANEGYNMLSETLLEKGEEFTPAVYPTAQTLDGYEGKGVKMQTKSTGSLGSWMQSPLAAGSMFLGYFKLEYPTIKSTRFGQPYNNKKAPKAVSGFFKYKAGKEFIVNNAPSELKKDTWDAYAILFEKRKEENYLLGDHSFSDDRIVNVARISDDLHIETDEWLPFEMSFDWEGKSFNPNADYMYTIVFSSSKEGDKFNGAVGSTLWIDEVEIITEE